MSTKRTAIISIASILVLAAIGTLVWGIVNREARKTAHFALLFDRSDSRTTGCETIESKVRELAMSPNATSKSQFFLFSTGDELTADEPVLLGKYTIPVSTRVLEGKTKIASEISKLMSKAKKRCEDEPIKKRSPIALGIMRVVETLRMNGCAEATGCRAVVQTDGDELSEPLIKDALTSANSNRSTPKASIPNKGIFIEICGFAQVGKSMDKRHNLEKTRRVAEVWKNLFTDSDLVEVVPHCS